MKQRGRRCFVAALVLVVVLGTAVRLSVWRDVFTASGVRLTVDTDANYHVLRAERLLHRDPTALWFDRGMNFPEGARILWPPGFDLLLSKSTAIVAGDHASRSDLERVSAVVPVALAALTLMLLAWSGARWVGRRAAIFATFLAAILPWPCGGASSGGRTTTSPSCSSSGPFSLLSNAQLAVGGALS